VPVRRLQPEPQVMMVAKSSLKAPMQKTQTKQVCIGDDDHDVVILPITRSTISMMLRFTYLFTWLLLKWSDCS